MEKLTKSFQTTGPCEVYVDKVIKAWDDRFSISQWRDDYRLLKRRRKNSETCAKLTISKEQAEEIIKGLKLMQLKSSVFNSGSSWHTKEFINSELMRLNDILGKKREETAMVSNMVKEYENSLNT